MTKAKTADRNCELVRLIQDEWLLEATDPATGRTLPGQIEPFKLHRHQRRVLNQFFTKRRQPGEYRARMPYRTLVYSCPKKSGKTEVSAAVVWAWIRLYGGLGLSVANDKDQSRSNMFARILAFLRRLRAQDQETYHRLVKRVTGDTVELAEPGIITGLPGRIRAIPCDPYGEAGHEDLSIVNFDELWAYGRSEVTWRLWTELQPIPTLEHSCRFVTTYAGFFGESEVLYSVYEQAVRPDPQNPDIATGEHPPGLEDLPIYHQGSLCAYWDTRARMPWHTDQFLEEAREDPVVKLRPSEYRRLWQNRWTTGLEAFLDIEQLDRLMDDGERHGLANAYP